MRTFHSEATKVFRLAALFPALCAGSVDEKSFIMVKLIKLPAMIVCELNSGLDVYCMLRQTCASYTWGGPAQFLAPLIRLGLSNALARCSAALYKGLLRSGV